MTGKGPDRAARNTYRIETERLVLEVPAESDAPTLFALVGGEDRLEMTAGLLWDGPDAISETLGFIRKAQTELYGDSGFHWAIRDRTGTITDSPGTAIGMISARPSSEAGRGDVGYWLGKRYWGRGLMREALATVIDLCFEEFDQVKVEAEIFTANSRSKRLVESLGMQLEGTIRSSHHKRGEWVDAYIYGILRDEWNALRSS
ncbi:MAG: GNAT family N-acetyltransferase, partial [Acidimicrobiia bacterium]